MIRGYTIKTYRELEKLSDGNPVKDLAYACIAAEVPAHEVASMLKVSRTTLYNWISGKNKPNRIYLPLIEEATSKLTNIANSKKDNFYKTLGEKLGDNTPDA